MTAVANSSVLTSATTSLLKRCKTDLLKNNSTGCQIAAPFLEAHRRNAENNLAAKLHTTLSDARLSSLAADTLEPMHRANSMPEQLLNCNTKKQNDNKDMI